MSTEDLRLLDAACENRANEPARVLMNAFGVSTGREIVDLIAAAPVIVRGEFMKHVREAVDIQRRKETRRF